MNKEYIRQELEKCQKCSFGDDDEITEFLYDHPVYGIIGRGDTEVGAKVVAIRYLRKKAFQLERQAARLSL